jgi:RNA recognition motif-containing protein
VEEVLGRAIRVRLWEEKAGNDKKPQREMSARPDNCTTIFCGNLDYNIDDDKVSDGSSEFYTICAH